MLQLSLQSQKQGKTATTNLSVNSNAGETAITSPGSAWL